MRQDERAPFVTGLQQARIAAYPPGEFVGQESFMTAGEILTVARRAGIGPGVPVLDLCCGIAGPGRLVMEQLGCTYLGLDSSATAIEIARQRTEHLSARYQVAELPPLPPLPTGPFAVVLLLETMLAFADKRTLLREIARVLAPGGRLALTVEAGEPLTPAERAAMPDADTVHLIPLPELRRLLAAVGARVRWRQECTASHLAVVDSLLHHLAVRADEISAHVGERAVRDLLAAHGLWRDWLRSGRVRKFALVAERVAG